MTFGLPDTAVPGIPLRTDPVRPDESRAEVRAEAPPSYDQRKHLRRSALRRARFDALCLITVVTIAASAAPKSFLLWWIWRDNVLGIGRLPWPMVAHVGLLLVACVLVAARPHRYGLRIGRIRGHWRRVLVVCSLPPVATWLLFPLLGEPPMRAVHVTTWLVSPLAQQLIFLGFIYAYLAPRFRVYIHPRVRIRTALVFAMLFWGLWHVPNYGTMPAGFVTVQIFYTGVLGIVLGLTRQWTGSILYATLSHAAVNAIVWTTIHFGA